PHDADWTNPSVRSFAMQLLSPDEPSLLILVNGSDENVRFHLPTNINNTCSHGLYVDEGVKSGTMYHLNPDLGLWAACDDYEDIEKMVREGKPLTQPIDDYDSKLA
ncbi:hypothetical protein, partial [Bifidobacterium adolescentis]|uniref:hypothetical protein n=1 Tax=Bifidobacterium adolescentis TaxID=1680 RepID=UPI0040645842